MEPHAEIRPQPLLPELPVHPRVHQLVLHDENSPTYQVLFTGGRNRCLERVLDYMKQYPKANGIWLVSPRGAAEWFPIENIAED